MASPARLSGRFRRLLLTLVALPVVVLMALAMPLPANEDDEGLLTRTLQSFLSDAGREVRIRGFQGALSSRATIRELTISDAEGPWLALHQVVLDWDRAALFARRVEVNELTAERIEVLRAPNTRSDGLSMPSPTAREPFALPELPVAIRIGQVRADRVNLGASLLGEAASFTLQGSVQLEGGQGEARIDAVRIDGGDGEFRLAGRFDNVSRRLVLDLSLIEGPDGIAAGLIGIPDRPALSLTAQGDDPIAAFRADIRLATDGRERVTGAVTFLDTSPDQGLLDGAVFRLDVGGDLRPLLAPNLHGFFGADSRLVAEGSRTEAGEVLLNQLTATTQALTLDGRAELRADGVPSLIDLRLDLAGPNGAPVILPGTDGQGRLREAALAVSFDASQGPEWTVLGRLNDLDLTELAIEQVVLDARGLLGVLDQSSGGQTPGPVFDGTFEFAATGIAATDPALQDALGTEIYGLASLVAPGGGEPLQISGLSLEGQTLSLTGQGVLDGLEFDGFVEFEAPDLSPFSGLAQRPLDGSALVSLRGRVHPLTGALDLTAGLTTTDLSLNLPEADNLLAGRAGIEVSVLRDTSGTVLRGLNVRAGTLGLAAQGQIALGASSLGARLRLTDLSRMGDGYGGALALDLDFREREGTRHVDLSGTVTNLALGELPGAAQLAGLLQGETRLTGRIAETAGAVRIEALSLSGPRLSMAATGTLSQAAQSLSLRLDRLALAPLVSGWSGDVAGRADLVGGPHGRRLTVDLASPGAIRTGVAALDGILAQGVTLRAQAREEAGDLLLDNARLTARGLDVRASGAQLDDGTLTLALDGGLEGIGQLLPGVDGAARIEARLNRPAGAQDIETRLTLTGPSQLGLTAQGRIGPDLRLALNVSGGVEAGIANPFIAPATVQGMVNANGSITGPPQLSSVRLTLSVSDGRYVLPGVGVAFGGITGTATLTGRRADIDLSGESLRGGSVQVGGVLDLGPQPTANLTATATRLRIAQARLFEGSVTGTVTLRGPLTTGPTVTGTLAVDEAEIRIPNSPLGRGGFVPDGLRHVGEDAASRETRLRAGLTTAQVRDDADTRTPLFLDLTLDAPGRVFVRGRGLDAEMGGTLRLGGSTLDTIPAGAFTLIRGRLDLLGNRFTLTEGTASMLGTFMPVVRLVATTDSSGVITSIILEGPADGPEIRFESVPELPQDEVLARLLFGRALASLSPFQAAQLGMSIATLTGRAESSLFDRTRSALGLDDLDVSTDADGNAALRAGRYLGERVYTDISVNSAGRSEVTIQLDLTPSVTIRGRADTEGRSAVGLFFERDY
jgi:translocation and assembly module TamB